jgi:hypothetical protein
MAQVCYFGRTDASGRFAVPQVAPDRCYTYAINSIGKQILQNLENRY